MKKFIISLLVILVINASNAISIDQNFMENLYDKIMVILEGVTDPKANEKECINFLVKNKPDILNLVIQILPVIEDIYNVSLIMAEFISKYPLAEQILFSHCDGDRFIYLYSYSIDDELRINLIAEIGNYIKQNVDEFHEASSNFVNVRGIDGKLILLGKIISIMFNIKFT